MQAGDDLTAEALEPLLGKRKLQSHPVLLSVASHASEWADSGAPDGAVVVAGSQVAARGRAAKHRSEPGKGLTFALVLRPAMAADKEGFLHTLVLTGLADVCGPGVTIEWPDEVRRGDDTVAAASVEVRLGAQGVKSAVVNVLLPEAEPPRGDLLAAVVQAIEARVDGSREAALDDFRRMCSTLGRYIYVQLHGGRSRIDGTAVDIIDDGALVIATPAGKRVPLRPQDVSTLRYG